RRWTTSPGSAGSTWRRCRWRPGNCAAWLGSGNSHRPDGAISVIPSGRCPVRRSRPHYGRAIMRISRSAIVAAVPVVMLAVAAPMAVAEPDPATELQVVVEEDSGAQTEVTLECDPGAGPRAVAVPEPATGRQAGVAVQSGAPTGVPLEGDPVGGTHPDADRACQMLADGNGDPAEVSHSDGPCVFVYQPITGRISGHW